MNMVSSSFYDRKLDDVAMKIAKSSIGETPESKANGLQKLKKKLLSIDDLKSRLDDDFLLRFLRVAKFDVNKAYDRVRKYYLTKKKYPHVFELYYPSATTSALQARHFHASPNRSAEHTAIVIHKRGLFDPSIMVFEDMFLLDMLILDFLVENPLTQIVGITVILDFNGYSLKHFFQDTPRRLHMALDSFQNTLPVRFKDIHVLNAPSIFSLLYNIAYPFLSKKIRNRLHVHSSNEALLSYLPPEVLPAEFGGKIPKSDVIDLVEEVIHKENYFKEQLQYGFRKT